MKKQMKLLLFALLVVLMVATLAIFVSAAETTEGAEDAYYSVETAEGTAYYSTITEAITAVKESGTITILKDASEKAVNLSVAGEKTYTITGGDTQKTLTITDTAKPYTTGTTCYLYIKTGTVTLKNIILDTTVTTAPNATIYFQNQTHESTGAQANRSTHVGHLILDNFDTEVASVYGLWIHRLCDLTIQNGSELSGGTTNIVRLNANAVYSIVTVKDSTLTGQIYSTANCGYTDHNTYINIENSTLTSLSGQTLFNFTSNANTPTYNEDGSQKTTGLYLNITGASTVLNGNNVSIFTTAEGEINVTGATINATTMVFAANASASVKLDGVKLNLAGAAVCGSSAVNSVVAITDAVLTLSNGADAPVLSDYKTFTVTSATVTDTASFVLNQSGNVAIGTKAELVTAIKANAEYAYLTIPEAWHSVTMNNDDLKITLSGDALAQQSGETPFVTALKGTLIAIEKGVTTYTEGTHFFKVNIEGTDYYYATLEDAVGEVVANGTITLLANYTATAPKLDSAVTYTIDGAGFTMTFTPADYDYTGESACPALIYICAGKITIKNVTLAMAAGVDSAKALIYIQNTVSTTPADVTLTLEDVISEAKTEYGIWLHQYSCLTVKGEKTAIMGGTKGLIRVQAGAGAATVNVEAGTFGSYLTDTSVSGGDGNYMIVLKGTGSVLNLTGGSFESSGGIVYVNAAATANIGGTATLVTDNKNYTGVVKLATAGSTLNISGEAYFELKSTGKGYALTSGNLKNLTVNISGNPTIKNGTASHSLCMYGGDASAPAKLTISGGTFYSNKNYPIALYSPTNVTLTGGRFENASQELGAFVIKANATYNFSVQGGIEFASSKQALIHFNSAQTATINFTNLDDQPFDLGVGGIFITTSTPTVTLKGGSFVSKDRDYVYHLKSGANLTVEDMTVVHSGNKTMFYANSGANNSVITVKSGSYTAGRLMYSYSNHADGKRVQTYNFEGGTFTSNATSGLHFIHVPCHGTTVNISGGEFYANAKNASLIGLNSGGDFEITNGIKTINITGGKFDGGQQWFFANSGVKLTISNATFTDVNNTLTGYGAIRIRTNGSIEGEVSTVEINSGSFTTNENSSVAIFYLEEHDVTINGGTFTANRIAALYKHNETNEVAFNLTFNGGLYYVRGDKALVSTSCYGSSGASDVVTFNGGTFVIAGENSALIYGADSDFGAINLERVTLYTTSKTPVLYGMLANNALFTYVAGSKQVTANGVGKYAGTVYNVYTMGAATDESLDVSNSDQTLEGASIWVSSNATVTGIRFYTVLSAEAQETIASLEGSELAFGTIIAPADYVAVAGAFTIEALEKLSVSGEKYVKIPAKYAIRDENGDGIPEAYSAALVNIKEKNFTRGFAAISYVEVDGEIYYGAYDFEKNVRSIRDVSKAILASGIFEDDQIEALTTFAGFKADESALVSTTWNAGKINASGAIEAADGYVYSDVIHLEKAGTTLTVIDADGNFAGADTTVFSQWTAEGATADCADNYLATDAAVAYTYGNTTAYTYTSSFDNEYIRVSYAVNTTPAVYMQVTTAVGTLKGDQARYDAYRINKLVNGTYDEALEGLHVVAIGDSYFDDPNVTPYTWIEQLAKKYSMTLDNYGISGSTIAADERDDVEGKGVTRGNKPMVNRVYGLEDQYNGKDDLVSIDQNGDETVDIVFFDGGRNDLTRGILLGEQTLDNDDVTTVCGAMNLIIEQLRILYPNAIIIGINPWAVNRSYALDYNGDGVVGIDEDSDGAISSAEKALETHTQLEYSAAVKAMFELNGVVCFDLTDKEATGVDMDNAAFREANCKTFADISHLNAYGAACFLPKIEAFVAEQYKASIAG